MADDSSKDPNGSQNDMPDQLEDIKVDPEYQTENSVIVEEENLNSMEIEGQTSKQNVDDVNQDSPSPKAVRTENRDQDSIKEEEIAKPDPEIITTKQPANDNGNESVLIPEDIEAKKLCPSNGSPKEDLKKLHSICKRLAEGDSDPKLGDCILPLILSEDMSDIRNFEALQTLFVDYLQVLPPKVLSGILSILIATVKKSVFHLELSRGLLIPSLKHLVSNSSDEETDDGESFSTVSLTKHFLCEWINLLLAHSCDVEELKHILKLSEQAPELLAYVQQANMKQRNRPTAFFAFPGTRGSMMSLPPFQKWPIQMGWSFSAWLLLEPKACAQPYLYNFKTGKSGLGYSAHFTGNCLVLTSIRVKGKGVQHCVAHEFPSHKWIHCAITYHNKWRASEIRVYVNGQALPAIEMPWQVQTSEIFDKCFIGGSEAISSANRTGELNSFCGQVSAIYLFNEGLSPAQICAIHRLGPSYMGQFKYSNESHVNLPQKVRKSLYGEKLSSTIFCMFSPVAVDSGTLCIQLAPLRSSTSAPAHNYFISSPHAALLGQTKAILTQPISSTIQSIGCTRSLLPLMDSFANGGMSRACAFVVAFICDLLDCSPHYFANDIVQNNGLVVIACSLASNPRQLLSQELLNVFLNLTRSLLTASNTLNDLMLLKNVVDNILINPNLWVYAEPSLQLELYSYLANEFLHGTSRTTNNYNSDIPVPSLHGKSQTIYTAYNPSSSAASASVTNQTNNVVDNVSSFVATDMLFGEVRRVSTVLQCLHAIKYYYWIGEEDEINMKATDKSLRSGKDDLILIRAQILLFMRELIVRSNAVPLDETQGILNYLASCKQPDNLLDVMDTLGFLLQRYPATMVPALDQKQGIRVIFDLISSKSEQIRIKALQLLTMLLSKCSHKRKQDIMGPNNLFMLLRDRLKPYLPMTSNLYEALFKLMLEWEVSFDDSKTEPIKKRIENSVVIKVIASLLRDEYTEFRSFEVSKEKQRTIDTDIKSRFINDLWFLIIDSRENRRIILQMSVWQHWLINLIGSTVSDSQLIRDQVLAIFRVLLHHATRYEYGGWRVWIDTLAVIHTKVSLDEFLHNQASIASTSTCLPSEEVVPNHDPPSSNVHSTNSQAETNSEQEMSKEPKPSEVQDVTTKIEDCKDMDKEDQTVIVSSISESVPRESSGIQMSEIDKDPDSERYINEIDSKINDATERMSEIDLSTSDNPLTEEVVSPKEFKSSLDNQNRESFSKSESLDSMDVAPTRAYRKFSKDSALHSSEQNGSAQVDDDHDVSIEPAKEESNDKLSKDTSSNQQQSSNKTASVTASPAFRIPEFKWNSLLIKLLNDLLFSIECDLYNWRCSGNCMNLDVPPFVPRSVNQVGTGSNSGSHSNNRSSTAATSYLEQLLLRNENQIYLVNIIHFVSQLSDNIIIASGGLLPLLADATGGCRNSNSEPSSPDIAPDTCEGLLSQQANSLLYRLTNIIDMVVFAASHINLSELEADKSTTNGGILRQCLRLSCTVTVKNCLIIRSMINKMTISDANIQLVTNEADFPRYLFDSYQGCSLLSANSLFSQCPDLESTDLVSNPEFSPHQTPISSSMPPLLPFQSNPIKDLNKLIQPIDSSRIQACIYHNTNLESRESQFLALSSLYFISVLMVSRYRDIIEPKQQDQKKVDQQESVITEITLKESSTDETISNVESSFATFGQMKPTEPEPTNKYSMTDLLTKRLEDTLEVACPLLKSIMCDFCTFLSKTLIGSHGQDLVNKEADRAFRCANTSPVELVMLLCSQEWQNTLQKNAGLAFIELINEGRMSSIGMKEHIVRVAMEAEFILSRLRADDVSRHEMFNISSTDSRQSRIHEETLINSLLNSALRRDFAFYHKLRESIQTRGDRFYKLDTWEDDDRRRRRFIVDSCSDKLQQFFTLKSESQNIDSLPTVSDKAENTKRILELQETIEMSGIDDHCSPRGHIRQQDVQDHQSSMNRNNRGLSEDKDFECDDEEFDDEDEDDQNQEGSDSDQGRTDSRVKYNREEEREGTSKVTNFHTDNKISTEGTGSGSKYGIDHRSQKNSNQNNWTLEDCNSINEFTGSVVYATECSLIWNIYAIPGTLQITNDELHFEPMQNIIEIIDAFKKNPDGDFSEIRLEELYKSKNNHNRSTTESREKHGYHSDTVVGQTILRKVDLRVLCYCDFLTCNGKIHLGDIRAIFSRHYLLQPHAIEIFLAHRTTIMFALPDFDIVKRVVKYLPPVGVGIKYGIPQSRRASLMTARQLFAASNMTQKWQRRQIGNLQYLMFLNTIAGRTYQDLNQYPVFPWILTNYESDELDLNLPSNFRDLSKPVGALNSERRNEFVERYQTWDNPRIPPFHYGTHYSTAAFTLNWLCRIRGSYNSAYLALHDGKYEDEARLFTSVGNSWVGSLAGGQQNVKELIPEFFYLSEMFHSNLGLPEVVLPPWAKNMPERFVRLHRLALESELVSCQLHQWIDLIFGYKQRGSEAINAINTFYYLTYQGNVNLSMVQDASLREAIATQIRHFGQTPSQLLNEPHPPRFSALHASPSVFTPANDELNKVIKLPFNSSIVHISLCIEDNVFKTALSTGIETQGSSTGTVPSSNCAHRASILTITGNNQYQIHSWNPNDQSGRPFVVDPQVEQSSTRRQLIDIDDISSKTSIKLLKYASSSSFKNDQIHEVEWPKAHYVTTLDGRFLIMGSFFDNSFRVFSTNNGKLCQVIYGHRAPITCMSRSDGNANADFYLATGSQDCSLLLWTWNEKYSQIEGSGVSAVHNPLPKLTISGHLTPVLSTYVSAELGMIISGSRNLILTHNTTNGESLLEIDVDLPRLFENVAASRLYRSRMTPDISIPRPQVKDKEKTLLEASMLGQPRESDKIEPASLDPKATSSSSDRYMNDKFSSLKEFCRGDYYITNLEILRELAFIACVALPPPKPSRYHQNHDLSREKDTGSPPCALLLTFNLKGSLMECTTIGQPINGPRLGDVCLMRATPDGEHLVLNDSPTSLKVYRSFDLQPIYAYNTNDIQNAPSEEQNRVRSLSLVNQRFILVGLDNGKIAVYNADCKIFN